MRRTHPSRATAVARRVLAAAALALGMGPGMALAGQPAPWTELGRVATPEEVRAWDIDVRADFTGLPAGSGSVADGMDIWDAQCATCHGTFGESNEFFTPIVGGTSEADAERGRVASLTGDSEPQRTTLMKLSRISTLWDYTRRAMPWTAPKSLSVDEVYAVVAYILNLGEIVGDDFVLSDRNIAEVQARLPNRDGTVFHRPMWDVAGAPDVQGEDCMRDCGTADVHSMLPRHARDAHGNLALQNRIIGPMRGADTTRDPPGTLEETRRLARAAVTAPATTIDAAATPARLAQTHNCMTCHATERAMVGPAFRAIATRYADSADGSASLARAVREGSQGVWGAVPMPPNAGLADDDIHAIVEWILAGAP
ncbi:MAG: c-type cytochrome [Burkholderiaceae bacterium]